MSAGEILSLLLKVNLAAGAAILIVAGLRKPARRLLGARIAYGLWLLPVLAAVAILLPPRVILIEPAPPGQSAPVVAAPSFAPAAEVAEVAPVFTLDPSLFVVGVWLLGTLAALAVMIRLQARFTAECRKGMTGPAVVGAWRPRVVTPSDFQTRFTPEEQTLVLAHEEAHLERKHSRINALTALAQCLFWFNPLIHLAAYLARIDQELACDEAVVTRFPDSRRTYAEGLVKTQLANRPLPLGCYWPSGTEHPLLERLSMLKTSNIGPARRLAGAWAVALVCTATAVGAWAAKPPELRLAPPPRPERTGPIPEVAPTGEIPAYGSYPVGSPDSHIAVTTPVMAPAGAMRQVFDPAATALLPQEAAPLATAWTSPAPLPAVAMPQAPTGFIHFDDAEANGLAVSVVGVVARVQWINPQALITVVDANGGETVVASQTPNTLIRHGVTRDVLKAGMPIRIDGHRAADGRVMARVTAMSSEGRPLAGRDNTGQVPPAQNAGGGQITDRSVLTNAVIRDGQPPATSKPMTAPRMMRFPTAQELMAVYPEPAMRLEKAGSARLDCVVGPSGALEACSAVATNGATDDLGFGAAALKLAPAFRVDTESTEGRSAVGKPISVPVRFSFQ